MTGKNTKPHKERKTGRKAADKFRRRNEAEARNAKWNSLTALEKLASLRARRGESKKQIQRLSKKEV